ncbi:acetate/propionate family kinase [Pseudoalteromonas rhizosphaerae]|uniref:acetate/propionate family kinase n=1 Tax=Pseudoalteromonas rhizosphaerae TaxID=2518973 RepID=UPI0021475BDC|nr:acetate/propionate family kinase [Pseudoalteromonas rhizosphaerae]
MSVVNMHILTINAGSSSIKFAVFTPAGLATPLLSGKIERIGMAGTLLTFVDKQRNLDGRLQPDCDDHQEAAKFLINWLQQHIGFEKITAVGHRLVHGWQHAKPELITPALLAELRDIIPYAPEHLPNEILLIDTLQQQFPKLPQVACFDTAFHHSLPPVAKLLPIPRRFDALGIQRYGFHGISYTYLMTALANNYQNTPLPQRIILAHLGNGASMAAVLDGRCIDTSMGFTPCGGLVMGSRCGDLDPGVIHYIKLHENINSQQCNHLLNHQSGLLGVSEISADMRDLLPLENTDQRAAQAIELFCYQAKKWLGAYSASLNGLDTLVFSGGIGENAASVRAKICAGMQYLGIELDQTRNNNHESIISIAGGAVTVHVIHTDEEQMIASMVCELLMLDGSQ